MNTKKADNLPNAITENPYQANLLNWPGRGAPSFCVPDGWFVGEAIPSLPFGFIGQGEAEKLDDDFDALIVTGQRVPALAAIKEHFGALVGLAYLDLPRLKATEVTDERHRLPTWLTTVESHVAAAANSLRKNGAVAVHIDDEGAAYVRAVLDNLFGYAAHEATVLWQKKYAPQNDLSGRIDDAHDFIFIFRPNADFSAVPEKRKGFWWPFSYAGKTEDATREVEELRKAGVISGANIPKTSKPARLITRLLEHFCAEDDLLLEVFSDTGFAASAAVSGGRRAILLGGDTPLERASITECSFSRLEHALRSRSATEVRLHQVELEQPNPPVAAKLNLRDTPVHFGPSRDVVAASSRAVTVMAQLHSIRVGEGVTLDSTGGFPQMRVHGETLTTLFALAPVLRASAKVTLIDCDPVPSQLDEPSWARWVADFRDRLDVCGRLLDPDGFVVVALDDASYSAARLVASSEVGQQRYAGTIALGAGAEPESATFLRYFMVFRPLPELSPRKIGLPASREFFNPDRDPRGDWRDPGHKGARSGGTNTAFTYFMPPYRWEVVRGKLPTGTWRLNETSGVIWAPKLTRAGRYRFVVRVTDSQNAASEATCEIIVGEGGEPVVVDDVWWMSGTPKGTSGVPKIQSDALPRGVVGMPYRAILKAGGGNPFAGSTVPGTSTSDGKRTRYWEFANYTLAKAILEDDVLFGPHGDAKPRIKRRPDKSGKWAINVELSWWDSDRLAGEEPASRLARILSSEDSLVVTAAARTPQEVVAVGSNRRLVQIVESLDEAVTAHLEEPLGKYDLQTRVLTLNFSATEFATRLAWLEGFLPTSVMPTDFPVELLELISGIAPWRKEACLIMPPESWPTAGFCMRVAAQLRPHFVRLVIYHFRGSPPRSIPGVEFRRVPFDLACRPRR